MKPLGRALLRGGCLVSARIALRAAAYGLRSAGLEFAFGQHLDLPLTLPWNIFAPHGDGLAASEAKRFLQFSQGTEMIYGVLSLHGALTVVGYSHLKHGYHYMSSIVTIVDPTIGPTMPIGQRIKEARKEANISQGVLAKKLGISRAAVSFWESGDVKDLRMENLFAVAEALEVNPKWLALGVGQKKLGGDPKLREFERVYYSVTDDGKRLIDGSLEVARNLYLKDNFKGESKE